MLAAMIRTHGSIHRAVIPACRSCRWMSLCGAGCMGNAYEANGDALTADGYQMREQWLRELFAARIGQMPASRTDLVPADADPSSIGRRMTREIAAIEKNCDIASELVAAKAQREDLKKKQEAKQREAATTF